MSLAELEMPGTRRRTVVPRRRREDDQGEDEGSQVGDLDDFSMSEGSAISNGDDEADGEGSEISAEDEEPHVPAVDMKKSDHAHDGPTQHTPGLTDAIANHDTAHEPANSGTVKDGLYSTQEQDLEFPGQADTEDMASESAGHPSSTPNPMGNRKETPAERARREHLEYVRQKNSNPAFVPNRGGFFLHDDRTAASSSPYGRPFHRGRGRGFNGGFGVGRGYNQPLPGSTDKQWAHDLHDTVNKATITPPVKDHTGNNSIPTAKAAVTAPNRTFSISSVLGNVTVQVFLPGMYQKKTFQNVAKKQHTLLPQHRPPLRRDKPVRISIPDEDPRYIFPSAERSFIFIPRAMRPNQQMYTRGRGRGSFQGSRRPSVMGSTYTPSVAMSRRSSLGGVGSTGFVTPTEGTLPRGPTAQNFNRPIVRMPVAPIQGMGAQPMMMPQVPVYGLPQFGEQNVHTPAVLQSPTVALPMHQPRPQKTVSVAGIESPAFRPPQQQQEQPFHQQVPAGVGLSNVPNVQQSQIPPNFAMNTPLSHIPEGAVYAQPFQPYPVYPQGGYYAPTFPGGQMMFQPPADPYAMGMGGPVMAQQYPPGPQNFMSAAQINDGGVQAGAVAHETNGMVYYFEPVQFSTDGFHVHQYPTTGVPMAGSMYYPTTAGGMYYAPTAQ